MSSIPLDQLDRGAYPGWLPGKVRAMLEHARRTYRRCLLCGHPAKHWHVWMAPGMSTLAADSVTMLRSYATCGGCAQRPIEAIEMALGVRQEETHATD